MSRPLTPAELAAERAAWKERMRRRREEEDKSLERSTTHPWRRFTAASTSIGWDDEYIPHGYSGTGRKL